ncbi:MAG: hypothetical protein ABIP90_09215, partial [Vicinamibacterales bacterium]
MIDTGGDRRISVMPDGVWLSNMAAGTIIRIDPKTNMLGTPVSAGPAGIGPCQPVVGAFKSLWVALCGSRGLARVTVASEKPAEVVTAKPAETATDKTAGKMPGKPAEKAKDESPVTVAVDVRNAGPLTTGTGSVWMITDTAGTVARIDPDTNSVVAEISMPAGATAIAFASGAIWVASSSSDTVTRIDAETNVVDETIKVGR